MLSNTMADLAERIASISALADASLAAASAAYLEAGVLLCDARERSQHGNWLTFLERARMGERKAQRLMQLARSGLKSDTVSGLGGIKGALDYLAQRRLPAPGEMTVVAAGEAKPDLFVLVWPSPAHVSFYHIAAFGPDGGDVMMRPVQGQPVRTQDGWLHGVWHAVELMAPMLDASEVTFHIIPDSGWTSRLLLVSDDQVASDV